MGLPFLLEEICGPILGKYITAHRHMNVEIGAEAVQFPEKEYINGIAVAVQLRFTYFHKLAKLSPSPSPSTPIAEMKRRGGAPCCRGAGTTTMVSGTPRPSPWRRKRELGRPNQIFVPWNCKEEDICFICCRVPEQY
jgi:hypothetical protein